MIKYEIKRMDRYVVTRCDETETEALASKEFDSAETAYEVGYALARAEQEQLGLAPGDDGVCFPERV